MLSKWVYSGEQLHDVSEHSLYRSRSVDEYVSDTRKLILISSKGMGKTHLLRRKRNNLAQEAHSGVLFIPSSSGSDVDRQTYLPKNMGESHWSGIRLSDWAALWEIAISLSVLLNYQPSKDRTDEMLARLADVADLPDTPPAIAELIYQKLEGDFPTLANPTYILNSLLEVTASRRQRLLRASQNSILQLYPKFVSSAVFVFIDSFDQTLAETELGNTDLWVNGQVGLALAAYNVNVNCSHIKVFTSVRQEAWNKLNHENKNVIESYSTVLRYTETELRSMLDHLSRLYEGVSGLKDVFELNKRGVIRNRRVMTPGEGEVEEEIFDYVYRHSTGTPRSIVQIMHSITSQVERSAGPDVTEKQIRQEVNLHASAIADTKINSEMASFLDFLGRSPDRTRFFSMVRRNVLSFNDLEGISTKLSESGIDAHPFCELFNLGLLGVVRKDVDGEVIQFFKSPLDFDWRVERCLPRSDYYLLHPALEAYLSKTFRVDIEPNIVVRPGGQWREKWEQEIATRTLKIFISYATVDNALKDGVVRAISTVLLDEGIRHEFWIDRRNISASDTLTEEIEKGIRWADVMVALVTPGYLDSGWCMSELRTMQSECMTKKHKALMPFMSDGANRKDLGEIAVSKLVPSLEDAEPSSLVSVGLEVRSFWRKRKNASLK